MKADPDHPDSCFGPFWPPASPGCRGVASALEREAAAAALSGRAKPRATDLAILPFVRLQKSGT